MTTVQDLLPRLTELAASIDWFTALKTAVTAVGVVLCLGVLLRIFFGRNSSVVRAVSACLSVGLAYSLYALLPGIRSVLPELPFLAVRETDMALLDFRLMAEQELYSALLRLYLLSWLVNCMESFLPKGEKLLSWYFLRLTTVCGSLGLYTLACRLIDTHIPQVFAQWAGPILAVLWGLILLTGLVKLFVTVALSVVNPILGAAYGFFFANLFGKQLPKSILTTLLTAALICLLCSLGVRTLTFTHLTPAACVPSCIITLLALYIFGKFL